jgi:hypothetical protein
LDRMHMISKQENSRIGFLVFILLNAFQFIGFQVKAETTDFDPLTLIVLAFDFDDTIIFTSTKIYISNKNTGIEIGVSTRDFTEVRDYVGKNKPIPPELLDRLHPQLRTSIESALHGKDGLTLESFQIKGEAGGSFRDFEDKPDRNIYLESIVKAIEDSKGSNTWQGPRWKSFVEALKNPKMAKNVYAISARSHDPEMVYEALVYLKSIGLIENVPPMENLKMVGGKKFERYGSSTEEKKTNVMAEILDGLNLRATKAKISAGLRSMAKAIFADDDFQNIEKMKHGLENLARWPLINVVLEYVGTVNPFVEAGNFYLDVPKKSTICRKAIAL